MLHPQNGVRVVAIDSVTSLHPMYRRNRPTEPVGCVPLNFGGRGDQGYRVGPKK